VKLLIAHINAINVFSGTLNPTHFTSLRVENLWLQEWNKAGAACQWTLMTLIVLYILTLFNEFRYITIKLEANVMDPKISNYGW